MEEESWREVVGFEGLYEVSDLGRVRSLDRVVNTRPGKTRTIPGKVLKLTPGKGGYLSLLLYARSVGSTVRPCKRSLVNRLVAKAFLPAPSRHEVQVDHKDFDRANNHADNLRWKTPSGNVQHSVLSGRWAQAHNSATNPRKWKKVSLEVVRSVILSVESGEKTKYRWAKDLGVSCAMLTRYCQQRDRYFPIT